MCLFIGIVAKPWAPTTIAVITKTDDIIAIKFGALSHRYSIHYALIQFMNSILGLGEGNKTIVQVCSGS
jgi:hypothetical protein